jgi:tryptophan synthase alpha chain
MITRTTTAGRLRNILKYAEGYLYLVSVLGVTGSRNSLQEDTTGFIKSIRKQTSLPLALGFGISKAEQIEQAARAGIDGVIAGSAIINVIENHLENPATAAEAFIKDLLRPLEYQASIRS